MAQAMMQTLILTDFLPPSGKAGVARATAFTRPTGQTKAADIFFAATAGAGEASEEESCAIIASVVDIVAVGSGRCLPSLPGSSANLQLIVEGWAYRAHVLANGARQITDVLLPGDAVVPTSTVTRDSEQDLRACGPAEVALLRRDVVTGRDLPALRRRWEWLQDAEAQRLRTRIVSLGRRDARERIAHFMAEQHDRLRRVGLADGRSFMCPFTQEQLADVLGLTSVHVNRVLQRLRSDGALMFNRGQVVVPDPARLQAVAGICRGTANERYGRFL